MHNKKKNSLKSITITLTLMFLILTIIGLYVSSKYISNQLLQSNETMAIDIAELVRNNFTITDEEVAYMKSLSFNEMEVDPINLRLMNIGNGASLITKVTNVYLVAPLFDNEIKYIAKGETAEFFGYEENTPLNGIWLLNGTIDENGQFVATQRDDIYRYTALTEFQLHGMNKKVPTSEYSSDAWGEFITGYSPVFTVEGNFVGLLGIDVEPDRYQHNANAMILFIVFFFTITVITIVSIFLIFYNKYTRIKEQQLTFEFYSRMSHDMRTPMNGILGITNLSYDENDPNTLHENLKKIEGAGKYMLGLINDTLDLRKMEDDHLILFKEAIHYQDILNQTITIIKSTADKKNIKLTVQSKGIDENTCFNMDVMRSKQILMNLLSNAIKFSPDNGEVKLETEVLKKEDKTWNLKISVSDNGVGMSEAFIKNKLFKPFEQETNLLISKYTGSGLGLAITKRLVDLMAGRIEVNSVQGQGTTFSIFLTLEKVNQNTVASTNENSTLKQENYKALKDSRVLLVEDNKLNMTITKRLLEKINIIVDCAENGEIAVNLFNTSSPNYYNAILMDLHMPVMDGLEATEKIRSMTREDALIIPIIALTANAFAEDKEMTKSAGMNDHLIKPIDPKLLYETLCKYIINSKNE